MLRIWRAVGVQPAIYVPPTLMFTATTQNVTMPWAVGKNAFLRGPALFLPVPLSLCPLEQRIHERTRPLRPCHAVASSTCSQSTVNRCLTNRPTGCSFVRSRWRGWSIICQPMRFRSKFVATIRAVAWYVAVDLRYRMPERNLRTYRAVINVRLNGSMITR